MLEPHDGEDLIAQLWKTAVETTRLLESEEQFFNPQAPTLGHFQDRRAYHRYGYRNRAIVTHEGKTLAVYARDISRIGIGFCSPLQLFPMDEVEILLPGPRRVSLQITRCWREAPKCYNCGARFLLQHSSATSESKACDVSN